ncbi:MAG: hypothetical protein Q9166_004388 [cf. Caloplaca sp. 2 TL-2023]
MPNLLDLPLELLTQIAKHVEPGVPADITCLRPFGGGPPDHFFTCKRWYDVVMPVYYEGLVRPKKAHLSSDDLSRIPRKQTQIYHYLCNKLEKLSLRLQGQPSDGVAVLPFFHHPGESLENKDDSESLLQQDPAESSDTDSDIEDFETASLVSFSTSSIRNLNMARPFVKSEWKDEIAGRLRVLSQLIADCSSLDEVSFQAFHGFDEDPYPQWNYLDCGAMEHFVLRLPPTLTYLTLDLAGTDVTAGSKSASKHLCPAISHCLASAENVRLRLRHICPSVFNIKVIHSSNQQRSSQRTNSQHIASRGGRRRHRSNRRRGLRSTADRQNSNQVPGEPTGQPKLQYIMHQDPYVSGNARLKSLVVRLCLPSFPADMDTMEYGDTPLFDSIQCRSFEASRHFGLPRLMALAARHFLTLEPGIESLKISYKDPSYDSVRLYATDCVNWKILYSGEPQSCYEDDGEEWEDWENRTDLLKKELPTPAELIQMVVDSRLVRPAGSTMAFDESSEDDEDAASAFAEALYPGAMAAGLEIGDVMDLLEHDMIFGEDHGPF